METNEDSVSDVLQPWGKSPEGDVSASSRPLDLSRGLPTLPTRTVVRRLGESISIVRETYIQPEEISANFLISSRRRVLGLTLVKVQFVFPLENLSILFHNLFFIPFRRSYVYVCIYVYIWSSSF